MATLPKPLVLLLPFAMQMVCAPPEKDIFIKTPSFALKDLQLSASQRLLYTQMVQKF